MTERIEYSFPLSASVCEELDETAAQLANNSEAAERDNMLLLSEAWASEASELFKKKYLSFLSKQKEIAAEIEKESEAVRKLSRHLYMLEEAAKKAVAEKGTSIK